MQSSNKQNETNHPPKRINIQIVKNYPAQTENKISPLLTPNHQSATSLPLKHRLFSNYKIITNNISDSHHNVFKAKKIQDFKKKDSLYFLKQNKSQPHDIYMYQIEAAINAVCHYLAPLHTSTSRVLYDEKKGDIAIISKNLEGFVPAKLDPLKEEHLLITVLDKCTIEDLEDLDQRMIKENLNIKKKPPNHVFFEVLKINSENKFIKIPITVKDMLHYRIVKGNAISLSANYALENDDCHSFNISKEGLILDFDMWLWKEVYSFKESGIIDWAFREPANRFPITTNDIEDHPDIKDAQPFYGPTFQARIIPESIRTVASTMFNVSKNAFRAEDNLVYKKLKTHPVYIHHKFRSFLKFCLTDKDHYRNLLSLHIREDIVRDGNKVIDRLLDRIEFRKNMTKEKLCESKQFRQFLETQGDTALKYIILELAKQNDHYIKKLDKNPLYQKQLVNLSAVIDEYANLAARCSIIKNQEKIKANKMIAAAIKKCEKYFQERQTHITNKL